MLVGRGTKCAICGKFVTDTQRLDAAIRSGRMLHGSCLARNPSVDVTALPTWPATRVGYFREFTKKPANPWLRESVQQSPSDDEALVLAHLRAGVVLVASSREVRDPIDPGHMVIGNESILTDETWDWPSYLSALIVTYHVRLDERFIGHVRAFVSTSEYLGSHEHGRPK